MVTINNGINNTVGASNSGATNTLTVQNTSNTASSAAQIKTTVGGTSADDCYISYDNGTTFYSLGMDHVNSGRLTFTSNTSAVKPSSGNRLAYFGSDSTSFVFDTVNAVQVGASGKAGGTVDLNIVNSSTTAASDARLNLQVSSSSGGNAYSIYTGPSNAWAHGVDKSDSNKWKLTQGTTGSFPFSTVAISATTAGVVQMANGITFDGTNILSQYLDWNTWTPTLFGATTAGTTTYTAQFGYYMVLGKTVFIQFRVTCSAATGTGNMQIGGLPYSTRNIGNYFITGVCSVGNNGVSWPAGTTHCTLYANGGQNALGIIGSGSTANNNFFQMQNTNIAIDGFMVYRID